MNQFVRSTNKNKLIRNYSTKNKKGNQSGNLKNINHFILNSRNPSH